MHLSSFRLRSFPGLAALAAVALLAAGSGTAPLAAATPVPMAVPRDGDAFSTLAAQAASGDPATDFRALRLAWPDSAARKRKTPTAPLIVQMRQAAGAGQHERVRDLARAIIAVDFIDMRAHKYLRQSCAALGDTACSELSHFIEFGLLKSIVTVASGRSMASPWEVVSIDEEYFILEMAGMTLDRQSLVSEGGRSFDRMDVTTEEGEKAVVFFDVSAFIGRQPA